MRAVGLVCQNGVGRCLHIGAGIAEESNILACLVRLHVGISCDSHLNRTPCLELPSNY